MNAVLFEGDSLGGGSQIHVLIVGVSAYPNLPASTAAPPPEGWPRGTPTLGLVQLDSAAIGAFRLSQWFIRNRNLLSLPLGSVRALLSPSSVELAAEPSMPRNVPATIENMWLTVREWREAAATHADNVTIFYFAGHGIQRRRGDLVLLLHDFGASKAPLLRSAFSVDDLSLGMQPSVLRSKMALRQLNFLDACRLESEVFKNYEQFSASILWDREEGGEDVPDRDNPTFYATAPGRPAYGIRGSHSVFCEALLRCLEGGAATFPVAARPDHPDPWRVTVHSLKTGLDMLIQDVNSAAGTTQNVLCDHFGRDFELCAFPVPPPVRVDVRVGPPPARTCIKLSLIPSGGTPITDAGPPISNPQMLTVPAGGYTLRGKVVGNPAPFSDPDPTFVLAHPPHVDVTHVTLKPP